MSQIDDAKINLVSKVLKNSGIVVIRTDTLYGVIARTVSKKAVEKVYDAKQRDVNKQCIVLIAKPEDVPTHAEVITHHTAEAQAPTSIVVPASDEPEWILRGSDSVAYRVVKDENLRKIIEQVGPVIAPSANPESRPPARNIAEAKAYFGNSVDLYVDGGEVPVETQASKIIRLNDDSTVEHLR